MTKRKPPQVTTRVDEAAQAVVTAVQAGRRQITGDDITRKPPTRLSIPIRALDELEFLALGLRQEMLSLHDHADPTLAGTVMTGAGVGSDWIMLRWRRAGQEQFAAVRGSELLRAWVRSFDPLGADLFPAEVGE